MSLVLCLITDPQFLLGEIVFNINEYQQYIKSKIEIIYTRKGSFTENQVISFCSQWDLSANKYFNKLDTSKKLRRIFGSSLKNKPKAVEINTYFLFLYGFIRCYHCLENKSLDNFSNNATTYTGLNRYCKQCHIVIQQEYRDNNREVVRAAKARRRAAELKAAPPWLSDEHNKQILAIYTKAFIENKVVDHIVPLQGKTVCGLHVPWNLQILDSTLNTSKGNKLMLTKEELFEQNYLN